MGDKKNKPVFDFGFDLTQAEETEERRVSKKETRFLIPCANKFAADIMAKVPTEFQEEVAVLLKQGNPHISLSTVDNDGNARVFDGEVQCDFREFYLYAYDPSLADTATREKSVLLHMGRNGRGGRNYLGVFPKTLWTIWNKMFRASRGIAEKDKETQIPAGQAVGLSAGDQEVDLTD